VPNSFPVVMGLAIMCGPVLVWLMDQLIKPDQGRFRAALFMVACAAASVLTVWVLSHGVHIVLN